MTTNIGHQEILENKKEQAISELKKYLKPEFINRIDEIVIFNSLDEKVINEIIVKLLEELTHRLKNDDIDVIFDDSLIAKIRQEAYDSTYGARPIKRYIQKHIENYLANEILANKIQKNKKYKIYLDKNKRIALMEAKKN
jgi:ATP-dependent Clp protease ATP-binding subunit ClpB